MSTDAVDALVTSSPLRADALDAASDLLGTPPGATAKAGAGAETPPNRPDSPSPPTVPTPELPPDSTTSDSPTGELNGTCASYSDGRAAQHLPANRLSCPEPTSTSPEAPPPTSRPELPSSTIDPPSDVPDRPVIPSSNGVARPRKPSRSLQNLDQIVRKLATVQNGHKTETPRSDAKAALDLTTRARIDADGAVKPVKWDIMKKTAAKESRKKPSPPVSISPISINQSTSINQPISINQPSMASENVNPLQLLRIPQYIPQSQDPNKVRSELRMMGLTGGATVVTHHSLASQIPSPHLPDDKRPYDKRFEVRPTALVNPFPGGESSSSVMSSRSFPKGFSIEGFAAKGTQMDGDFGRPASKGTQICVPNGTHSLWNPVDLEVNDLEKKRYPVPIAGPKKRRDRPTKVSNFHKLAASLVTTTPSAMPTSTAAPVAANAPKPSISLTVPSAKPSFSLTVPSTKPSVSLTVATAKPPTAAGPPVPPPVSLGYPLQPPLPPGEVRGAAKRKRTLKNMMAPMALPPPAPQMSSVGQQTLPIQPDLPIRLQADPGQSHLQANPGQLHMHNPGQPYLQANGQPHLANPGQAHLQSSSSQTPKANPGQSGKTMANPPDFSVASMLGASGGAVSITPLDVNRPLTGSAPVTDQAVVDRLKRLGTVIEVEEDANAPADKEPMGAPSALKMLEKMTIDPPQSPVVSALDDRPLFLGKDISVYAKKKGAPFVQAPKNSPLSIIPVGSPQGPSSVPVIESVKSLVKEQPKLPPPVPHLPLLTITKAATESRPAAVPQPVVTVTKTASTQMDSPESDLEPPFTLLEPVIVLDEDDPPNDSPLADGFFVFRHDSTLSVELPNDQKVFSCDICSAAFHHLHMLRKHYFRLHVARKYISEKDLEAYNIDPEKCDDSNDEFIYRCHTCRQCLPTKTELKSHLTDHPPAADLTKHIKGAKDYKCEKCNAHFKWRKMFGKHKRNCRIPVGSKIEDSKKSEEQSSDESPVKDQHITSVTELALRQVIDMRASSEAAPIPVEMVNTVAEVKATSESMTMTEPEATMPEAVPKADEPVAIPESKIDEVLPETKNPKVPESKLEVMPEGKKLDVLPETKPETSKRPQRTRNPPQQSKPLRRTRQTVAMAVHSPPELPQECLPPPKVPEPSEPASTATEQSFQTAAAIAPVAEPTPSLESKTLTPPVQAQPATCDGECQTNFNDPPPSFSPGRSIQATPNASNSIEPSPTSTTPKEPAAASSQSAPAEQPPTVLTDSPKQPSSLPENPVQLDQNQNLPAPEPTISTQTDLELLPADCEPKTEPDSAEGTSQTSAAELTSQTSPADSVTKESATSESLSSSQNGPTLPVLVVSGDKLDLKGWHHCLYCNETFSNGHKKRNHTLKEHPYVRKNHPCVFCRTKETKETKTKTKETFLTPSALFSHLIGAHPTLYFACQTCKERFQSLVELRDHSAKRHSLDKDEQKDLDSRTSDVGEEVTSYSCPACLRIWLFKTCLLEHKCSPEKDKPANADKLQAGRHSKLRKVKVGERSDRPDKPIRVDPETMFYSQVALNVRNNLLHFLDGKVPQDEEEEEVEDDSAGKVPERNTLSFSAGFPSSSGFQLIEEPEPYSRVKAQWEKYSFPKNYDGRCGLTSYIKDMSYLDISTQMIMRRNLQRLQGSDVTLPSTSDDVPTSLALERLATQCAESFGINGIPGSDRESLTLGELSGEWVRDRVYICSVCSWDTPCLWTMEDHKYEFHPQVLCPQHELVGEQRCLADTIYKRVVGGPESTLTPERPNLRPHPVNKVACTKCGTDGWASRTELHVHILACAGEPIPQWAPTPRKRRWPKKRRRPRRGLKRNIPSTPHRPIKVRTKPGDTDTIQKMIANLPAKRSTRRVIGFEEDLKTRSQSTIQNCPVLLPSNRLVLPPSNHHKLSKGTQRGSPRPKELIYAPIPKETDLIDTSAERGDVLSSLRMMPVSTPREQLLEPRQIIDKVIHQKVFGQSMDDPAFHQCTGCGDTMESKVTLRKHQKGCAYFRECGRNADHKCQTCSNKFENLVALIEHSCHEMPKLEIEEDLSPANSADIPVLSPVQNEGKKLDSKNVVDSKTENGLFDLDDLESNMKRKRSHSLGDIPSGKKVFRPGHRRSARLGHAESGPLETTGQEEKSEKDATRAVTDSEDTSDLSQAQKPKPKKSRSERSTEKFAGHQLLANVIAADARAQSPSVNSENLDDDSLWETQAVVEDGEQENKAEGDLPTETAPKETAKDVKPKPKKHKRLKKRLTWKKKGRWVPKATRNNLNKEQSKPSEAENSESNTDSKPQEVVAESSKPTEVAPLITDSKSTDETKKITTEVVNEEIRLNTAEVVEHNIDAADEVLQDQPLPEAVVESEDILAEDDKPSTAHPKTKKGKSRAKFGVKKSKLAGKKVQSAGKLANKKGGKNLKLKVVREEKAESQAAELLQNAAAEEGKPETVEPSETTVEEETPKLPSAGETNIGMGAGVASIEDHLSMSIDAVANGTAETLRAIMESNNLSGLLEPIKSSNDDAASTDVPQVPAKNQTKSIADSSDAKQHTKPTKGQKKGKKGCVPIDDQSESSVLSKVEEPDQQDDISKGSKLKKKSASTTKSAQNHEDGPAEPIAVSCEQSEVDTINVVENDKGSKQKKKSKVAQTPKALQKQDSAAPAEKSYVEPEPAESLTSKRKSRTVVTQNETQKGQTDSSSAPNVEVENVDAVREVPKTRGKSKTTICPKQIQNEEPSENPVDKIETSASETQVKPEDKEPTLIKNVDVIEPPKTRGKSKMTVIPKIPTEETSGKEDDKTEISAGETQVKPENDRPTLRKRTAKSSQKVEEPEVAAEEVTVRVTRRSKKDLVPDVQVVENSADLGAKAGETAVETTELEVGQNGPVDEIETSDAAEDTRQTDGKGKKKPTKKSDVRDVNLPKDSGVVDVQTFYAAPKKGGKKVGKKAKVVDKSDPENQQVSDKPEEKLPEVPEVEEENPEEPAVDKEAQKEVSTEDTSVPTPEQKHPAEEFEKPKPKNKLLSGRLPSAGKAAALLSRKPLHQLESNPAEDAAKKRKVFSSNSAPAKRLTRSNSNGKDVKNDGVVDPYDYNEDEIVPFQEPRYKPYSPPKPVLYAPPTKRRVRKREASPDTTTIVVQAEVHPEPPPRRRPGAHPDPVSVSPNESTLKRKSPTTENSLNATKKSKIKTCYDGIDVMKEDEDSSSPPQLVPVVDSVESKSRQSKVEEPESKSIFSKNAQLGKAKSPLRTTSPVQRLSSRGSTPVRVGSPAGLTSPARVASPVRGSPARLASPARGSPARVVSPARLASPARASPIRASPAASPARVASPKRSPAVVSPAKGSPVRGTSPSLGSSPGRASPMRTTLPLRSYGRPPKAPSPPSEPPELIDESKVTIEEKLDADSSSPILEPSAGPLSDLFDSEPPALEPTTDLPVLSRNTSISGDDTMSTLDTEEDTDSLKSHKTAVSRKKNKDFLLKKKKQLLRIKALRNKKKKEVKKHIVGSSGKEVVKIAGFSWEVSDLKTSPVKAEPEPPPKPVEAPSVVPSLVKDWDAPDLWDSPIVPPAPAPVPVATTPPMIKTEPRPTQPSIPPVPAPGPRSTRSDSSASSGPTSSLGSILDSVNKLLNEPETNYSHLPSHYSLADLQKAMGASDAEMAVLQQLGEATQLSLTVGHGFEEPTVIAQPLTGDDEWGPMIMDLDNQAAQQPIVSSSVSGSPRRSSTDSTTGPPSQLSVPTTSIATNYPNRSLREDLSNLIKSSSMCKSLRMSPKCSSSTSLLAAHSNKEVVCPTCSRHFMGFPALQIHVNKVHGSSHDPTQVTGGLQNRRVVLESVKNSARLVCFECQQILPSQLMPRHLEVDHELEPSDISKCSTITGESHEGPVVGERLKSKISGALGDLFDKAVTNLLQVKVKPPLGQPAQSGLSGGAVELLNKLCLARRRDSANRINHKDMSFNKLKSEVKTEDDSSLTRGLSSDRSRPFLCTVCGQRFPLAASRNKHEVLAHRSFGNHENADLNAKEDDFYDDDDWRDAPSPTESTHDEGMACFPCYSCSDCGLSFESVPDLLKHRKEDHAPRRRESTASDAPPNILGSPEPSTAPATPVAPDTSTAPEVTGPTPPSTELPPAPDSSSTPSILLPQKITVASRSHSFDTTFLTGDFDDGISTRAKSSSRPGTPGGSPPTKRMKQRSRTPKAPQGTGIVKAKAEDALRLLSVPRS